MTKNEKEKVCYFRTMEGLGYKTIAAKVGVSADAVKGYCRRNGMTGVAKKQPVSACRYCGKELPEQKTGRKRKFCSDRCRNQWWKEHPQLVTRTAYYHSVCHCCGKEFAAYAHRGQKYCSHACYITARFRKSTLG